MHVLWHMYCTGTYVLFRSSVLQKVLYFISKFKKNMYTLTVMQEKEESREKVEEEEDEEEEEDTVRPLTRRINRKVEVATFVRNKNRLSSGNDWKNDCIHSGPRTLIAITDSRTRWKFFSFSLLTSSFHVLMKMIRDGESIIRIVKNSKRWISENR